MTISDFHLECRAEEAALHKRIEELGAKCNHSFFPIKTKYGTAYECSECECEITDELYEYITRLKARIEELEKRVIKLVSICAEYDVPEEALLESE